LSTVEGAAGLGATIAAPVASAAGTRICRAFKTDERLAPLVGRQLGAAFDAGGNHLEIIHGHSIQRVSRPRARSRGERGVNFFRLGAVDFVVGTVSPPEADYLR
jgi:hypothetical protein